MESIQIHEYDYQAYTHEIDEYKAYYEICENAELRLFVSAGLFAYVDNHFVLNHEKCVTSNEDGVPHLTDFAWSNLEKCTVKFRNVRINIKESGGKFSDILYRGKVYETFPRYSNADNGEMYAFARELAAEYTSKASEREKLRVPLCDRVGQIFEAKGIDPSAFQALTLLSRNTFYKFKSPNINPPLKRSSHCVPD